MKATPKQKKVFDKLFDQEWRKLFIHLMERKNVILTELLPNHDLKTATQTETAFFEDLARDAVCYWTRSYFKDSRPEYLHELESQDSVISQVNDILKKKKK